MKNCKHLTFSILFFVAVYQNPMASHPQQAIMSPGEQVISLINSANQSGSAPNLADINSILNSGGFSLQQQQYPQQMDQFQQQRFQPRSILCSETLTNEWRPAGMLLWT